VEVDRSTRGDGWLIAALLLVFAGVLGTLGALARWKGEPGAVGAIPERWPTRSTISRVEGRTTLLLFVSPTCPCSRASLHELEAITSHHDIDAIVITSGPIAPVPQARVVVDPREAQRFGALTSGQALVFSPEGRRLYAGGITLARGHEGDNAGARAVVAALSGTSAHEESPVYGCALAAEIAP
jgi:hypothetical protein